MRRCGGIPKMLCPGPGHRPPACLSAGIRTSYASGEGKGLRDSQVPSIRPRSTDPGVRTSTKYMPRHPLSAAWLVLVRRRHGRRVKPQEGNPVEMAEVAPWRALDGGADKLNSSVSTCRLGQPPRLVHLDNRPQGKHVTPSWFVELGSCLRPTRCAPCDAITRSCPQKPAKWTWPRADVLLPCLLSLDASCAFYSCLATGPAGSEPSPWPNVDCNISSEMRPF